MCNFSKRNVQFLPFFAVRLLTIQMVFERLLNGVYSLFESLYFQRVVSVKKFCFVV